MFSTIKHSSIDLHPYKVTNQDYPRMFITSGKKILLRIFQEKSLHSLKSTFFVIFGLVESSIHFPLKMQMVELFLLIGSSINLKNSYIPFFNTMELRITQHVTTGRAVVVSWSISFHVMVALTI